MYTHLHVLMIAPALAASACTLPTDDAGELAEQLDELAKTEVLDEPSELTYDDPDQGLIVCRLSIDHPHPSGHVTGNVNVVARTRCTSPVAEIQMQIALARDGLTMASRGDSRTGRDLLQINAATSCIKGVYQGRVWATIYFPPDYLPAPQRLYEISPSIPIECGIPAAGPRSPF